MNEKNKLSEDSELSEDQAAKRLEEVHQRLLENGSIENGPDSEIDEAELAPAKDILKLIAKVKNNSAGATPAATRLDDSTVADESNVFGRSEDDSGLSVDEIDFIVSKKKKKLSRFVIHEMLGQGGFGLVFRGFDPDLDREVAIKVPRAETLLTEDSRRRFVREAKTAAALSHPNIVTVYESSSEGSIIFQVSEYVPGTTLAKWLSNHEGPVSSCSAVKLVSTLADALQHAHSRGVIHRDVKPGNVLLDAANEHDISEQDLATRAKIGDFGLAKFVTDQTQTKVGAIVGTPAYMSPEQVTSKNRAIGPPADIYSLGVVFYELLTGQTPFVREKLVQTVSAIENLAPPPPSRLNGNVSRDLDAIVLKCLEKNPSARYLTAAELQSDLARYLNNEPVLARKLTPLMRVGRWVANNRLAAALLFILVAGIVGTTIGLVRARHAETEARLAEADAKSAEAEAKVEAKTAGRVSDFLVDLFKASDLMGGKPGEKHGKEITAEQILHLGATKVREELADEPVIQARLMETIGTVYVNLGMYDEAEPLLRDSLTIRHELLDTKDPEIADSHRALGRLLRAIEKNDEAAMHFDKAIKIFELDLATNFNELSGVYNDIGVMVRENDPNAARAAHQKARDIMAEYDPENEHIWALDANIAVLDVGIGQFESAKVAFENALENATRILGPDHPKLGTLMSNLAFVHRKLGNYDQALELQQQDLKLTAASLGDDHPTVGLAAINLIAICQRLGKLDLAIEYGEQALDIVKNKFPADHRYVSIALNNHALTKVRLGEYAEARSLIDDSMDRIASRTDENALVVNLKNSIILSRIERYDNNVELALEILDEVLAHELITEHNSVAIDAKVTQAFALAQLGRPEAETAYEEAMAMIAKNAMLEPDRLYVESRFAALQNQVDLAISKLEEAVEKGFKDAVILSDPDLNSIRDDSRFDRIVETLGFDD